MQRSVVMGVLVVLAFASAPVDAQLPEPQLSLDVTPNDAPITPITEVAEIDYILTVVCETGTARTDQAPIEIQMAVDVPDAWAVVTVAPKVHEVNAAAEDCLVGKSLEYNGTVGVTLSKDAPAGAVFPITLSATPSEGETVTSSWNETVGAYLNAQARFSKTIWQAPPASEVRLPIDIENFGNGIVRATFELADETLSLNITLAEPVEVAAGATGEALLIAQTPEANGYINRQDELVVKVRLTAVDDTSLVEEKKVAAVIQTQGTDVVEGAAVGPIMVVLVALIGLLAFRRH